MKTRSAWARSSALGSSESGRARTAISCEREGREGGEFHGQEGRRVSFTATHGEVALYGSLATMSAGCYDLRDGPLTTMQSCVLVSMLVPITLATPRRPNASAISSLITSWARVACHVQLGGGAMDETQAGSGGRGVSVTDSWGAALQPHAALAAAAAPTLGKGGLRSGWRSLRNSEATCLLA